MDFMNSGILRLRNCLIVFNLVLVVDIIWEVKFRIVLVMLLIRWFRFIWCVEVDVLVWLIVVVWCVSLVGLVMCDGLVSGFSFVVIVDVVV